MRIVIFTGNATRHRFMANQLSRKADDSLVVSEVKAGDSVGSYQDVSIKKHFDYRFKTEQKLFDGNNFFVSKTLPILSGEVNSGFVYKTVKEFRPDMMFVFGASIIKEPLLSLLQPDRFINLHLGLSPYYRGSGTNFWPFVNKELEYIGSTILHLDPGIDTGDIVAHVQPVIKKNDTVHTLGCKVIKESVLCLCLIMDMVAKGKKISRIKQWKDAKAHYYKNSDFTVGVLSQYNDNMRKRLIENYLNGPKKKIRIISLST